MSATTLDPAAGHLTLINTFTVDPANSEALLKVLSDATRTISGLPGFISANLHVSFDRRHIANYAQWRSQADLQAMYHNPATQAHIQEAAGLALSYEPIFYNLRESHGADLSA